MIWIHLVILPQMLKTDRGEMPCEVTFLKALRLPLPQRMRNLGLFMPTETPEKSITFRGCASPIPVCKMLVLEFPSWGHCQTKPSPGAFFAFPS